MKCIADKVLHASKVDELDDLDGWHVIRDIEQIKKRWVKLSDWLVLVVSLRGFWGSLGHCLLTRKCIRFTTKSSQRIGMSLAADLRTSNTRG